MLSTLDQGRKSKRAEIGIRQGLVQSRALARTPRAATRASGFRRRLPAHTPLDQFRIPLAACLPLSPKGAPYAPPDPRIQIPQHRRGFAEAEIASPAAHIPGQFRHHLLHAPPPALCRDFPNPLFDSSSTPCRRKLFIPGWLQFRKRPSDTLSLRLSRTGSKFSMSVAPVARRRRRLETPCPPRRMSGRGKRNPCR